MPDVSKPSCPECGGVVAGDYTCHTYPGGLRSDGTRGYLACMPCDSAIEYSCESCNWYYTDGLNPGNPRSKENESKRPKWLEGHMLYQNFFTTIHPEVQWYWELED